MLPGGTTNDKQQGKIELLSLWAVGRLSFAKTKKQKKQQKNNKTTKNKTTKNKNNKKTKNKQENNKTTTKCLHS